MQYILIENLAQRLFITNVSGRQFRLSEHLNFLKSPGCVSGTIRNIDSWKSRDLMWRNSLLTGKRLRDVGDAPSFD